MRRSIGSGTWFTVPVTPVAALTISTNWSRVRFSGPGTSTLAPRSSGSVTARSTIRATSPADTKLIGFWPRPKTRVLPAVTSGRPTISSQVSW